MWKMCDVFTDCSLGYKSHLSDNDLILLGITMPYNWEQ